MTDTLAIHGATHFVGLIGDPVAHSLSPGMHNQALAHMGLHWVYLPFAVPANQLEGAVRGLWSLGCQGFNLTIPHKERVLPLLQDLTPVARQVGAVNTVLRTAKGWLGDNTDVAGFMAPLQEQDWHAAHALVLGSGGAARAALAGCLRLGFTTVYVWGRNRSALEKIQQDFPLVQPLLALAPGVLKACTLVVNTTPLGMAGHAQQGASPLTDQQLAQLSPQTLVYDLVYVPEQTPLLQAAERQGLKTQGGLRMLVEQGAEALAHWTGQPVPVGVMLAQASRHLSQRVGTVLPPAIPGPEARPRPNGGQPGAQS
ncbi:shikimate dehydrogenase [Anthocerotibacter panamensis]|uniref:shikimate dehydrogenase n=1 Tax=Anthocerotibacter panamensis TaxID=2857077 RepID=UPI001FDA34DF|nr:shikimate dehydrogenase [Anthocerotibacter panamensis]